MVQTQFIFVALVGVMSNLCTIVTCSRTGISLKLKDRYTVESSLLLFAHFVLYLHSQARECQNSAEFTKQFVLQAKAVYQ
jgi:hypothetical protein